MLKISQCLFLPLFFPFMCKEIGHPKIILIRNNFDVEIFFFVCNAKANKHFFFLKIKMFA